MQGFIPLGEVSSMTTRSVLLRQLTDAETRVYQCFMEKLGNIRVPQKVELQVIANKLGINYNYARKYKNLLVKKGFIEQWTTTFRDPKGRGFRKATYYRIKF